MVTIDFDALDESYITGMEFVFFASLKEIDPFQPHLTMDERNEIVGGNCGAEWPLAYVAKRVDDYWTADDD